MSYRAAIAVCTAALSLAACGSGATEASPASTSASTTVTTSTTPTQTTAPSETTAPATTTAPVETSTPAQTSGSAQTTTPAATSGTARGRTTTIAAGDEAGFATADRGVRCSMQDDSVRCDVAGPTYTKPAKPATCEVDWAEGFQLTGGVASPTCAGDTVYSGTRKRPAWFVDGLDSAAPQGMQTLYVLGDGHTLTGSAVTCSATASAVTCTTTDRAHGFTASTASYRLW